MFSNYCTDIVKMIWVTHNSKGVKTKIISEDIPARIEDTNQLIRNNEGKEVMPNMLIMLDYEFQPDTTYMMIIKQKHGQTYYQPNKEWEIKKFDTLGLFGKTHIEVYI